MHECNPILCKPYRLISFWDNCVSMITLYWYSTLASYIACPWFSLAYLCDISSWHCWHPWWGLSSFSHGSGQGEGKGEGGRGRLLCGEVALARCHSVASCAISHTKNKSWNVYAAKYAKSPKLHSLFLRTTWYTIYTETIATKKII